MRSKLLIPFLTLVCFLSEIPVAIGDATLAHPETYFNKLAHSLLGQPPSREDWNSFYSAKKEGTLSQFFSSYIDSSLQKKEFNRKLKFKLDELLRLIPQKLYVHDKISDSYKRPPSSYDYLANEMIQNNWPWSTLLTQKNFTAEVDRTNFASSEAAFYFYLQGKPVVNLDIESLWDPGLISGGPRKFEFPAEDPRLAGVLSTPQFLLRYGNTALNKNRRRAAAIFRTFLCDSMVAAIPKRVKGDDSEDYDVLLPDALHKGVTEEDLRRNLAQTDLHGSSPDCRACHYKLDPMGETLGLSPATFLHDLPSPGALIYQKRNGSMVDVKVQGLSELGLAITRQSEYVQCQVDHFWTWYIGRDAPRSVLRNEQLIQVFTDVGGRPKDFVKYLVQTNEFKQKPKILTEDQLLSRQVAKLFKNCTSCHEDQNEDFEMKYWDMTAFPYSDSPRENQRLISKISKALDLPNKGLNRKMPPKDSFWKVSDQDLSLIQKWIARGAPDYEGAAQLKILNQVPVPPDMERPYR